MKQSLYGIAALAALMAGCTGSTSNTIVIGAAGPFSEARGELSRMGIQLAIKEINAAGGVRGRRLEMRAIDDSANGVVAVRVAESFVNDPAVLAVVGHVTSGAMMSAARVYDGRLPAVATTASSPELSGISPWVFRTIASDSAAALAMARHASKAGYRRAAVLYENDSYGRALAEMFRRNFTGEVVTMDPIAASTTDLEPFVTFYRDRRLDVIVVAGAEASGLAVLREARRQSLDAVFIGANSWVGIAMADPAAAEGALVFTAFTPTDPRPEVRRFVQSFRAEYGREPTSHAALAYDATLAIGQAIAKGGPSRDAVRDWLAGLDEKSAVAGVTGPVRFRTTGDRLGRDVVITRARGGQLTVEGTE